jgi:hypothetical protein
LAEERVKAETQRKINWPGVIAGVLFIALPFLERWWILQFGMEEAGRAAFLVMAVSPFGIDVSLFGEPVAISPLLWWLILGFKLGIVYLGVLLVIGSVLTISNRSVRMAELFVHFSARKLLWLVIVFVVILLLICALVNYIPSMLGLPIQLDVPYLIGMKSLSLTLGDNLELTIPVVMRFTQAFGVAVVAAALGVIALIYQKRLLGDG